ncbi:MAG: ribosomal-protein-alanine N-acetyltransferase [Alteromonadaceae bacterium]|jgi:ribosomal-protein-alanine N-acetyltransferase
MKNKHINQNAICYSNFLVETDRLIIRPYNIEDDKRYRPICENTLNKQKADTISNESFCKLVKKYNDNWDLNVEFTFGLFCNKTNYHLGELELLVINKQLRWGNLGIEILSEYRGKGYANESFQGGLAIAFEKLNFHRIESSTELTNTGALNLLNNVNSMIFEGNRRKFFPQAGGTDMSVYAANAIDFKKDSE